MSSKDPEDPPEPDDVAWMDRFDSLEVREARAKMRLVPKAEATQPPAEDPDTMYARAPDIAGMARGMLTTKKFDGVDIEAIIESAEEVIRQASEVLPVHPEADQQLVDLMRRLPEAPSRPLRNESALGPRLLEEHPVEALSPAADQVEVPAEEDGEDGEGDDGEENEDLGPPLPVDPDAEEDEVDSFGQEDEDDRREKAAAEAIKKRLWKCRGCKGKPSMTCSCTWCREAYGPCHNCGRYYSVVKPKRALASHRRIITADMAQGMAARKYFATGMKEFDRVIGGGLLMGNLLMLGGERGAGKTTLLIQIASLFAKKNNKKVFIALGEMTQQAAIEYVKRLEAFDKRVGIYGNMRGIDVREMLDDAIGMGAKVIFIDSIQYCVLDDMRKADIGSPAMIDACMSTISAEIQSKKISVVLVSHLNKAGDYAGTQKSQHAPDGLVRFDNRSVFENGAAVEGTEGLREIYMDDKSRQGSSRERALVEMIEVADEHGPPGIRSPSARALRALARAEGRIV